MIGGPIRLRWGASVWGFYGRREPASWPTLPEAVRALLSVDRSLGVEVWGAKSLDGPGIDEEELVELAAACQDAAFVTAHVRGRHWRWQPHGLRREIEFAERVGATALILHPECLGLTCPENRLDVPEIRRIAGYAADRGVRLALENMRDSIWLLDRVLEEIGDDPETSNLGVCIDTGHAHLSGDAGREPVENYLERYAGSLIHVHLHDNRGDADDHLIPGDGTIDWSRTLNAMARIGFEGTAVLEIHPRPDDTVASAVEQGWTMLRAAR